MADVDTKEVTKFFRKVMDLIQSREQMLRLGGFTIKIIEQRTRGEGKGVLIAGGQARKLKRVQPEYAARRSKMKGRHPAAATGTDSNLTLFGPLLSTMMVRRATKTDLRIGHQSLREDLKAEGQAKQGRRFLLLSGKEMQQAKEFLVNLVADELK